MPIYEYECRVCGEQFEAFVRDATLPACPSCASGELERLLSNFAVRSEGTRNLALQDGKRRSARVKQEKDHAQLAYEREHTH